MRELRVSVAVSAGLHVAAVAWFGTHDFDTRRDIAAPPSLTEIELVPASAPTSPSAYAAPPPPAHATPSPPSADTTPSPHTTAEHQGDPAPPSPSADTTPSPSARATLPAPSTDAARDTSDPRRDASADPRHGARDNTRDSRGTARDHTHDLPGERVAIETGHGPPGDTPGEPSGDGSRRHVPLFDMRANSRPDLSLPVGRDDLDHPPAGSNPETVKRTGKLAPNGAAGAKSDQTVFVAKVAEDGTVTMKDRRDFQLHWDPLTPKQFLRGVADWFESDKGIDAKRGKQTLKDDISIALGPETESGAKGFVVRLFRGRLSIDDWIMRKTVGDPYASKKLDFLDSTRDERVAMGEQYRRRQLEQVVVIIRANCERAWAASRDPAARKRALFELWDEIADPDPSDELAVVAAQRAREQVIAFIRIRLPPGSPDAYTGDEIQALVAHKQSAASFAPYE